MFKHRSPRYCSTVAVHLSCKEKVVGSIPTSSNSSSYYGSPWVPSIRCFFPATHVRPALRGWGVCITEHCLYFVWFEMHTWETLCLYQLYIRETQESRYRLLPALWRNGSVFPFYPRRQRERLRVRAPLGLLEYSGGHRMVSTYLHNTGDTIAIWRSGSALGS